MNVIRLVVAFGGLWFAGIATGILIAGGQQASIDVFQCVALLLVAAAVFGSQRGDAKADETPSGGTDVH